MKQGRAPSAGEFGLLQRCSAGRDFHHCGSNGRHLLQMRIAERAPVFAAALSVSSHRGQATGRIALPPVPTCYCPSVRAPSHEGSNSKTKTEVTIAMKDFAGKFAVITGGGTGMGRELARQLVAEGCNVAMCDVSAEAMAETRALCEAQKLPQGLRVTTHVADVAIEGHLQRFRDELMEQQATDKIHLLFNNAGIGGGGSLFTNSREQWERTFNICWGGVYLGVRTFLPLMLKADKGHIINTSSVNGFWASVGMLRSHTAYSAAKFAVKGFTEALINDLRLNAPHIKCSVVMPGHIGTAIMSNSRKV